MSYIWPWGYCVGMKKPTSLHYNIKITIDTFHKEIIK